MWNNWNKYENHVIQNVKYICSTTFHTLGCTCGLVGTQNAAQRVTYIGLDSKIIVFEVSLRPELRCWSLWTTNPFWWGALASPSRTTHFRKAQPDVCSTYFLRTSPNTGFLYILSFALIVFRVITCRWSFCKQLHATWCDFVFQFWEFFGTQAYVI